MAIPPLASSDELAESPVAIFPTNELTAETPVLRTESEFPEATQVPSTSPGVVPLIKRQSPFRFPPNRRYPVNRVPLEPSRTIARLELFTAAIWLKVLF